ncbi:hypothetical protein KP509_36G019300 [Ceratopteris richardii]|uniref:Uncharacterized protein n=1 Tax=Ceratopteris richardii TaxID=49495 RepID=A0A8T2QAZ7_CERRI|nr:hypothetical protein KP509_36G019200 [Ceratopteris richardii]KAH7280885.1 hypothetical protein KP509_36G019300 [Ceratopteris richardii]
MAAMRNMDVRSPIALISLAILAMMCFEVQAAKIETFNPASCDGSPTNTFYVGGNTCQTFIDQGAVRISEISSSTRVSVHNQRDCEGYSSVAQIYGPGCVVQGATKLRAVWIQG